MIYLKFKIAGNFFALPVEYISESIQYTFITRVPKLPDYFLGVMNLRGKIIPVLDTRIRMGLKSIRQERNELIAELKKREKEHINWVKTLEDEVLNNKTISVQRDPTKCNFGKWYIPFKKNLDETTVNNSNTDNNLAGILDSFDEPHKKIHGVANEADELMKNGKADDAMHLIKKTKDTTLKLMIKLFNNLYNVINDQTTRDIIVIIQYQDKIFGLTIDSLDSTIEVDTLVEAPVKNDLVQEMCIIDEQAIQILNLDSFIEQTKKVA